MERVLMQLSERKSGRDGVEYVTLHTINEKGEHTYRGFAQLPGNWADLDYDGVYLLTLERVDDLRDLTNKESEAVTT